MMKMILFNGTKPLANAIKKLSKARVLISFIMSQSHKLN